MAKRLIFFIFVCIVSVSFGQTLQINEATSSVKFVFMDDEVEGSVSDFKFTGTIDASQLSNANFSGSVAMETLDTDNWLRNRHLRAKKYFYNKQHPRLLFKTTKIRGAESGKEFLIDGVLTIKGVSKTVTLNVNHSANRFYITGLINTSDFDINIHKEKERNTVNLYINLQYE